MPSNQDFRAIFTALLIVIDSQQRQLDELREQVNAIEGAANDITEGFSERREDIAAEISHATQHRLAQKADLTSELRELIFALLPQNP